MQRSSLRYEAQPEDPVNELIREALLELAQRFQRWGSPRMSWWLGSEYGINHKRVERQYNKLGLQLPRKRPKKKHGGPVQRRVVEASGRNQIWTLDFVHDLTELKQKLKILTVLDEGTRECLEIRAEKRMRSRDVVETLDELVTERGAPGYLRMDNGPEFIAAELHEWARDHNIQILHIEPGSPWENGYIESFNGKFRDECLNVELFWSRAEAQVVVDWYRHVYNWQRPHRALKGKPPAIAVGELKPVKPQTGVELN